MLSDSVTCLYAGRNIVNTIMTSGPTSLEKYTTHFIRNGYERFMCERWIGDWTKLQNIDPHPAFLILQGSSTWGPESSALCWSWSSLLRTEITDSKFWFPTNWLPVAPVYIIVWHPPASVSVASAPNSTHQQSSYPLISSTECICYLHRWISYLRARSGRRSIYYNGAY